MLQAFRVHSLGIGQSGQADPSYQRMGFSPRTWGWSVRHGGEALKDFLAWYSAEARPPLSRYFGIVFVAESPYSI